MNDEGQRSMNMLMRELYNRIMQVPKKLILRFSNQHVADVFIDFYTYIAKQQQLNTHVLSELDSLLFADLVIMSYDNYQHSYIISDRLMLYSVVSSTHIKYDYVVNDIALEWILKEMFDFTTNLRIRDYNNFRQFILDSKIGKVYAADISQEYNTIASIMHVFRTKLNKNQLHHLPINALYNLESLSKQDSMLEVLSRKMLQVIVSSEYINYYSNNKQ